MTFVLDNSLAMAWCFVDEQTPVTTGLLDLATETGAFAPSLWPYEAANALAMALRRQRIQPAEYTQLIDFLRSLPVTLDTASMDRAWDASAALATRFRLSVYDAAYLELAQRTGLPLATLDRPLRMAAATLGIPTLGLTG